MIPWNLTRHAAANRDADVIIVSPAKAGRTWLCVMINKYLSLKYDVPFSVDDLHRHYSPIPSILYTHWVWAHLRLADFKEWIRGRYIIPRETLQRKKIILLVRDPRDVMVSAYFHANHRWKDKNRVSIPIAEFIRHRKLGIASLTEGLNIAWRKLRGHSQHLIVKYEEMKSNPAEELRRILEFIGETVDPALITQAVSFGGFDNMKRMEQNNEFDSVKLRARDPNDPQSFKVRKGVVGGYVEHFNENDLIYLDKFLDKLNPHFGYGPRPN